MNKKIHLSPYVLTLINLTLSINIYYKELKHYLIDKDIFSLIDLDFKMQKNSKIALFH